MEIRLLVFAFRNDDVMRIERPCWWQLPAVAQQNHEESCARSLLCHFGVASSSSALSLVPGFVYLFIFH